MKPQLHEDWIDPYALRIVRTLQDEGFEAYLVGGCVRDLLAGIHPKDFDIATNASPQQVKKKIPNAYIIGKRFRLVLVKRGDTQFEVATFRRTASNDELSSEDNMIEGDNFFGTAEEDAKRRDFTINGLFYDPGSHRLIDYVSGIKDIESETLRMIGDPKARFIEDPIRILRAVRLSHKLAFRLEPELRGAIIETAPDLKKSVLPRRREEWLKILRLPEPRLTFQELYDLGVLREILAGLHLIFENTEKHAIFDSYLNRMFDAELNLHDPIEVFSGFMMAFMKAHFGEDELNYSALEIEQGLNFFMREELGMFKLEIAAMFRALYMIQGLKKTDTYLKRGERRKVAFLSHDAFSLALKLGQIDFSLSPTDIHFWKEQRKEFGLE